MKAVPCFAASSPGRRFVGLTAFAAMLLTGGLLRADDPKASSDAPKAQASPSPAAQTQTAAASKSTTPAPSPATAAAGATPEAKDVKKETKETTSADKFDLSTPASNLKMYGDAQVSYDARACKTVSASRPKHTEETEYRLRLGTDIKLTGDLTIGIQVEAGRANGGPLR
jgi:hypothetical protein